MNREKSNNEYPNDVNVKKIAKKIGIIGATLMAGITLNGCGNDNANAKPGDSEPKTEQSSKNTDQSSEDSLNFSDDTTQSSSEAESSSERQEVWSLNGFVGELKKAGFDVVSTEKSDGPHYRVDVEINGYGGYISASATSEECSIDFSKSLGGTMSGYAHDKNELYEAADNIKKYTAQK